LNIPKNGKPHFYFFRIIISALERPKIHLFFL